MRHDFKKIEPKWQAKWEESKIFRAVDGSEKPSFTDLLNFHIQVEPECMLDILKHIQV